MDGAWTAAAVRRAEARLMSKVPPGTLMQRAAAGLASECANLLKRRDPLRHSRAGVYGSTVIVLAGPGDNGGDALYAAARLARRGARVFAVPVMGDRVHPHAAAALTRAGGRLVSTPPQRCDLLLDGVLGIGGRPGLPGRAIDQLARIDAGVVVAVDVPSGVDVDTGAVPASAVTADVTVAFGSLKPCHVLGRAALLTGDLVLVDIGLGPYLDHPSVRVADDGDIAAWWHRPGPDDDKYTRGVVGVAAGSERYPGAAVLATSGALAGPAGYVRYAGAAADGVRRGRPEVVCTPTVKEAGRVQAWLVGPGVGTDEAALAELRQVLVSPAPAVIDADALTLIGEYPSELSRREAPVVLTPHDREYERLYGSPPSEDRAAAAAALAKRLNCTVLLKGHHTVVAASDGTVWANPTGRPQLATAGSGDVLAGFLASLLASGMDGVHAAVTAAYVHGRAAALASEGHRTMTASDLARALPEAIGAVLSRG